MPRKDELCFFFLATLPASAIDRDTSNQELSVPLRDKLSASYTISLQKSKFTLAQFLQYVYLCIVFCFYTVKYTSTRILRTRTHSTSYARARRHTHTHIHTRISLVQGSRRRTRFIMFFHLVYYDRCFSFCFHIIHARI